MPIATGLALGLGALSAGGALGGAALSAHAAGSAADAQSQAAQQATAAQVQLGNENLGLQQQIYNNTQANQKPFVEAGQNSVGALNRLMGLPSLNSAPAASQGPISVPGINGGTPSAGPADSTLQNKITSLIPRAKGGVVSPSRIPAAAQHYIVGERGPEELTMFPNGTGWVTPNGKSRLLGTHRAAGGPVDGGITTGNGIVGAGSYQPNGQPLPVQGYGGPSGSGSGAGFNGQYLTDPVRGAGGANGTGQGFSFDGSNLSQPILGAGGVAGSGTSPGFNGGGMGQPVVGGGGPAGTGGAGTVNPTARGPMTSNPAGTYTGNPLIDGGSTKPSQLNPFSSWTQQFVAPTAATEQNDPGYQFRMQQGEDAITNQASALGTTGSGATGAALQRYGQDYASNEYNNVYQRQLGQYDQNYNIFNNNQSNQFNRLASIAGLGQTSTNQLAGAGSQLGNNVSNTLNQVGGQIGQNLQNSAAAQASGYVGAANAYGGAINGISNAATMPLYLQYLQQNRGNPYGQAGGM